MRLCAVLFCTYLAAQPAPLRLATAADLEPVVAQLARQFTAESKVPVEVHAAPTGTLAREIYEGDTGGYDLFLSDNERWARDMIRARKGEVRSARIWAHGRIGMWSKSGRLRQPEQLTGADVKCVAVEDPNVAPSGFAARQFLRNKEILSALVPKLRVFPTATAALAAVEQGQCDAALVAWTLAAPRGGVQLTDALHPPIRVSAVIPAAAQHKPDAQRFIQFLFTPAARKIQERFGLLPPTVSGAPLPITP